MSRLLNLVLLFGLFVGMMSGAMAHAAETPGNAEVSTALEWLHADSDHDQVPADSDRDYPHHHNICHGHDLAAPMKSSGAVLSRTCAGAHIVSADSVPAAGPQRSPLRPPIS